MKKYNCEDKVFIRSKNRIEIDITYVCTLSCLNCDHSCGYNTLKEYMTIEQIRKFISESIEVDYKWLFINIMGGEPTLHPQVIDIIKLLREYVDEHSPKCDLCITSNGFTSKTKQILDELQKYCRIINTHKTGENPPFSPFNTAPIDDEDMKDDDFTKGCPKTSICGIGLNMYGYYQCSAAPSIDRYIKKDIGRKKLPKSSDLMHDIMKETCKYCGHFKDCALLRTKDYVVSSYLSPTWKKLYQQGASKLSEY